LRQTLHSQREVREQKIPQIKSQQNIENNTLQPSEDVTYIKENLILAVGDHSSRSPRSRDFPHPPHDQVIQQNVQIG
jgi:hypothetical protein